MLARFGWLFSLGSFAAVLLMAAVFVSPLGAVRIGGAEAKPILSRWNWFAITLCTTIATGILFWGAAEPMFHVAAPPAFAGVETEREGARFALSTLYLHWSVTPYAIYATPALAFALAYYNRGGSYSLSGPLRLLIGRRADGAIGAGLDAFSLFALVAGVAASLGAGVMTLAGGLGAVAGAPDGALTRLVITIAIVLAYVASSLSGLQRGIKILSDINIRFFFFLCAFILLTGPTLAILQLGLESVGVYMRDFLPRSMGLGGENGLLWNDQWTLDWTVFFFANWLAWAPITALFLGRISVGYTVREFLTFNLVLPAFFGMVWMTVFGGAAILINETDGGTLAAALQSDGPEAVIYVLLAALPLAGVMVVGFIATTFISFVTAMDSNTHSIAGVCLKPGAPDGLSGKPAVAVKIFWGVLIGAVSWVMTATNGIDGIRLLVNIGGVPGLIFLFGCGAVIVRFLFASTQSLNTPTAQALENVHTVSASEGQKKRLATI